MVTDWTGPCEPWASLEDVRACGPCSDDTAFPDDAIDLWLMPASEFLWAATLRAFNGECEDTVRPIGHRQPVLRGARGWRDASGVTRLPFGYCSSKEVALRWPIRAVTSVHVNGVLLDASAYRVFDRAWLRRVDGGVWPAWQDMDVEGTAEGAFQIVYTWGADPTELCVRAAAALVCELARACGDDSDCQLSPRVREVARAGLTYQLPGLADRLGDELTGVPVVDACIRTYNRSRLAEATRVIDPEDRARLRRSQ